MPSVSFRPYVRSRSRIVILAVLALIFAGCVLWLVKAERPWSGKIASRLQESKSLRLREYVVIGSWYGAAFNASAALALAVSLPLWMRARSRRESLPLDVPRGFRAVAFWGLLAGAIVFGASQRLPRMSHSLWNDEEYTLRRYVHGFRAPDDAKPANLKFDAVTWEETFFLNRGANNHVVFSVLARTSLAIWRTTTGAARAIFDESVYRMPSLIAGLASIGLLAVLGARVAKPWYGLPAAWLLALHPWHVRYSAEARGYSLLIFFALCAAYCLVSALHNGKWKWFAGFGLAQALFMLCFPGAVYLAVCFNGAALLALALRHYREKMWVLSMRLAVANVASAMLFILVYAPSVPQVKAYLARDIAQGQMDGSWIADVWSHLCMGVQWHAPGAAGSHLGTSAEMIFASAPWIRPVIVYLLPALAGIGAIAFFRRGLRVAAVFLAFVAAPVLAFLHTSSTGNFLFSWYVIYAVPALCLLWSVSPDAFVPFLRPAMYRRSAITISVLIVILMAMVTAPARRALIEVPRQPMREAVASVRASNPTAATLLTASFGTSGEQIRSYDPNVHAIEGDKISELGKLIEESDSGRIPLAVYLCGRDDAARVEPGMLAMVEDPSKFVMIGEFKGFEEMYSYRVYRHDPGLVRE